MFDLDSDLNTSFAVTLLIQYSFDLGGYTASELINRWLKDYPATWVCQSVIEALYQGRYKAVSVEQILFFWQRRGQALHRYNYEFERLICSNFPQILTGQTRRGAGGEGERGRGGEGEIGGSRGESKFNSPRVLPANNQTSEKSAQGNSSQRSAGSVSLASVEPTQSSVDDQRSRSLGSENHRPIRQFTPPADGSEFYTKLKAISQNSKDDPEQGTKREDL